MLSTYITVTFSAILLLSCCRDASASCPNRTAVLVNVPLLGLIKGIKCTFNDGTMIDAFRGIPFAKPPIGNLRFRAPVRLEPPPRGRRTIDATQLPATCMQVPHDVFGGRFYSWSKPNTNLSEDCLYLNVWRPSNKNSSGATVMVWIQGGAFSRDSSTLSQFDGGVLSAKGDVIVVSMQYRLGPFGFLALGRSAPGNAGLLDQQLALQWVRENIVAFGGDPRRVTLFGQSAGSASISYHLLSPGSAGLFNSVVMESGAIETRWNYASQNKAQRNAIDWASQVGCITSKRLDVTRIINCLRQLGAEQLNIKTDITFLPTVDGTFIDKPPGELLRTGKFQRKDTIIGFTRNEGTFLLSDSFPRLFDPTINRTNIELSKNVYMELVGELLGTTNELFVNSVASKYLTQCNLGGRTSTSPDYALALINFMSDLRIVCPSVNFARISVAHSTAKSVYFYSFNHRPPPSTNPWPVWAGVTHTHEIDYVFGAPFRGDSYSLFTDKDRTLSDYIITYWSNFAKTGDPNQSGVRTPSTPKLPVWPQYTIDKQTALILDIGDQLTIQSGLKECECDYLFAKTNSNQGRWMNVLYTVVGKRKQKRENKRIEKRDKIQERVRKGRRKSKR